MKKLLTLIIGLLLCSASYSQQYMYLTTNFSNPSACAVAVRVRYITKSTTNISWKHMMVVGNGNTTTNSQVLYVPYDTTTIITHINVAILAPIQQLCTCGMVWDCNTYFNLYHNPVITIPFCWDKAVAPNYWYMLPNGVFIPCDFSQIPYCDSPLYNFNRDTTKIPNGYHGQAFEEVDSINVPNYIADIPKPTKKIIKIMDELGRETTPEPNKVFIYIYSDGTVERKIIIKD
jgi:hypothetical protein